MTGTNLIGEYDTVIDRPIFIVGAGRSGTTIFYDLICGHRDLGWFYENWLSYHLRDVSLVSFFAWLSILYKIPSISKRYRKKGFFPKPSEAYPLWDLFHPVDNGAASPPFTEEDVSSANVDLMQSVIEKHLHYSKTSRFVNKNTRNSRRMRYLHEIFPDALFIHVMRDGRAVASSLLNVGFWRSLSLWWCGGSTPIELEKKGEDPVVIAARHWKVGVEQILEDKKVIPEGQYLEVRYEDLMMRPKEIIRGVLDFCHLRWKGTFENHISSFALQSRNYKWSDKFTRAQMRVIENEIVPVLETLGYRE